MNINNLSEKEKATLIAMAGLGLYDHLTNGEPVPEEVERLINKRLSRFGAQKVKRDPGRELIGICYKTAESHCFEHDVFGGNDDE